MLILLTPAPRDQVWSSDGIHFGSEMQENRASACHGVCHQLFDRVA